MTIDSHIHFWKYDKRKDGWITDDMKVLKHDYLPETIASSLKRNGIDGCVAVQASQSELETHFLAELAETHDVIKGVVGWVDLQNDNIEERLAYFSRYPIIKGWRHVAQTEPPGFFLRESFKKGIGALHYYDYTYDILIYHHQLKEALQFVSGFPEMQFVLDHCAKPDIAGKKLEDWKNGIREMAQHPHVHCKISGLFTEARWKEWSAADFYPYLDVVFENFGTDRILFGSDWPVILLSGIYVQWKSLVEKYMENIDPEEVEKVMGGNAVNFYKLNQYGTGA